MKTRAFGILLATALATPAACGYTTGGDGSGTLEVVAKLTYKAKDNDMGVHILVKKDGVAVEGATITVKDGETNSSFTIPQANAGIDTVYMSDIAGYHRKISLVVSSGSGGDSINGKLEGPGSHKISGPDHNEIVKRSKIGDNLAVEWTTTDGIAANEVSIRLSQGDFQTTIKNDQGSYDISSASLINGPEEVRVTRRNRVKLDGGIGGSVLEVAYEVQNDIIVQE